MGKIEERINVLTNDNSLGNEFHLCECGYEECIPTKPYEFIPINYWVIHYCIDGEGFLEIKNQQNHIHAGDIFLIPAHTQNKYFPSTTNPWTYHWIGLRGTLVEQILEKCGLTSNQYILHYKIDHHLIDLFENVYDSFEQGQELKALGNALYILNYIQNNIYTTHGAQLSSGELYFQSALAYIHKYYFNNITISDIAMATNIDRTYVFKLFQKYANMSPSQYLQQYRITKACVLLRKTSYSVTDISYAVGFQHPPYFSKLFTQYNGISPSEYRKQFLSKPS